jgi:DNA repair protein RadC
MSLKDLPADARPREKLLARGPAALADAELLALLLRTGLKGQGVLQLAQALLDAFGGLGGLLRAQPADLKQVKGLGPAKRAEMAAVLEIARRSWRRSWRQRRNSTHPTRSSSSSRCTWAGWRTKSLLSSSSTASTACCR